MIAPYCADTVDTSRWINRGIETGAIYLIIVTDTFSYEDYPTYAFSETELHTLRSEYDRRNMQLIKRIIQLRKIPNRTYGHMVLRDKIRKPARFN